LFAFVINVNAQPVAGNDCTNALPILPTSAGAACVPNNFDLVSTDFTGIFPSCQSSSLPIYNDIWFIWNSGSVAVLDFVASSYGINIAVYRNSCGSLVEIDCLSFSSGELSGWNQNESLYIQVYNRSSSTSSATFCLNENCDPTVLTSITCTSDSTFTLDVDVLDMGGANSYILTVNSYLSSITNTIGSIGSYSYTDLSYITGASVLMQDATGVSTCGFNDFLYKECSCYMIEPSNDLCADAIPLVVSPNSCISSTMGELECAYQYEDDLSSCIYSNYGDILDVWYTFTAPASGSVTMDLIGTYGGTFYGTTYSLLDGTCGNYIEMDCNFSGVGINWSTLIPGNTYTIRVAINFIEGKVSNSALSQSVYGDFTICLYDPIGTCNPNLNLSGTINNGDYFVSDYINSNGIVVPGSNVYFDASNCIELQNGFSAEETFEAVIGGCNN